MHAAAAAEMRRARGLAAVASVDTGVEHPNLVYYGACSASTPTTDTATVITTHIVRAEGVVACCVRDEIGADPNPGTTALVASYTSGAEVSSIRKTRVRRN